jgi:hypothetical protein
MRRCEGPWDDARAWNAWIPPRWVVPVLILAALLLIGKLAFACTIDGGLSDPGCTPGDVEPITVEQLCTTTTTARRHVTQATKARVLRSYGLDPKRHATLEIDHLIPLELGGSNAITNLWPQPAPAFRRKDRLENELHRQVCAGLMPLELAQTKIALDWLALYRTWIDEKGGTQ